MAQKPTDNLRDELLSVLRRHLKFAKPAETFPMDAELESLGLDSISTVDLLLALEETFKILFPEDMLAPGIFRTARSLEGAVQSLVKEDGAAL